MMAAWHLEFRNWSKQHYVLFPAAVYAGNRFAVRKLGYPPRLSAEDALPDCPVIVTDVPRLELSGDNSAIALQMADCAQPVVGIWNPHERLAWLIYSAPTTEAGASSWMLEEDVQGKSGSLRLCAPGVRPWRYRWGASADSRAESLDKPAQLTDGDALTLPLEVEVFSCASAETLFSRLFERRGALCPPPFIRNQEEEMKRAQALIQDKYLRQNWSAATSLFFSQLTPGLTPYQAGWVGGMLAVWGLVQGTNPLCRQYAIRNFVNELTNGMAKGGLFYGKATRDGRWIPDFALDVRHPLSKSTRWTMVRRQADALYAGLHVAFALDGKPDRPPELQQCDIALCRVADALSGIWKKAGTFGQYLDQETNEIIVGNSTAAALVPGALAIAGRRYRRPEFIEIARQVGEKLYWDWTFNGVTCGGPGDALQCPDSESAFAMVESFVALARITKDQRWMERAAAAAHQAATWVMPYDFQFPQGSEFHRLDMHTTGTVWANAQNKHSAPGIATLSGEGLAVIESAHKNSGFGALLGSMRNALPQFLSTVERPIHDLNGLALPVGWMDEKVTTSDFMGAENVGNVQHESSWCEVSLLLSAHSPDAKNLAVLGEV